MVNSSSQQLGQDVVVYTGVPHTPFQIQQSGAANQQPNMESLFKWLLRYTWLLFLAFGDLLGHGGEAVGFFIYLINILFKDAERNNLLAATVFLQGFSLLLALPDAVNCWRSIEKKARPGAITTTEHTPLLSTSAAPIAQRHSSRFAASMSTTCCKINWLTSVMTPIKEFFAACGVLMTYALFWETFHCGFGKDTDFDVSVGALILSAPMTVLIFLGSLCCHYYLIKRSNRPRLLPQDTALALTDPSDDQAIPQSTNHATNRSAAFLCLLSCWQFIVKWWPDVASATKELFGGIKTFVGYEALFRTYFDYEINSSFKISTKAAIPAAIIAAYATICSMIFHVQFNHAHQHASVPQACSGNQHSFFWNHLRKLQRQIRILDLYGHGSEVMDAGAYLLYSGLQDRLPEWAFITVMTLLLILSFVLALPDNHSCDVNLQELVAEEDLLERNSPSAAGNSILVSIL